MKVIYEKSIRDLIKEACYEADINNKKIKEILLTEEEFNSLSKTIATYGLLDYQGFGNKIEFSGVVCIKAQT